MAPKTSAKPKTQRINLRLDAALWDALITLAERTDRPVSRIVREAIAANLQKRKP